MDRFSSRVTVVSPPSVDPSSVPELRAHLRIAHTDEDQYLEFLIGVSTEMAQEYTGRKFISQGLEAKFDNVRRKNVWWSGVLEGAASDVLGGIGDSLTLPWAPVQTVSSVSTFDDSDNETTFAAENYRVDTTDPNQLARIVLKETSIWPTDLRNIKSLKVSYVVGYGATSADVPSVIRHGILTLASYLYENRGDCSCSNAVRLSGISAALDTYRILKL